MLMNDLYGFLALQSTRSLIYLSLTYGINPWHVKLSQKEISEFLGITEGNLNVSREKLFKNLRSRNAHAAFEKALGQTLPNPIAAHRKRKDHYKRLRHLTAISRSSYGKHVEV
ncbi:hypothetical protein AHIS1_p012 [Acaryochloris phage A-HIS1]|nr:hypothetical protein AHIS1_p012 [Acaryochloris phage A-HIS1]